MKIRNHEIAQLVSFLFTLPLTGKASRMRMRLIDKLNESFNQFEKERMIIAHTYAKKDENGESVIREEENGNKIIVFANDDSSISANREISDLMNEFAIIEENETNQDMLITVKNAVLDKIDSDETEYFGQDAANRNRYYEIFDSVNY